MLGFTISERASEGLFAGEEYPQRFLESIIHWSHSLVVFRHRSDERNPTDVTGRPAPEKYTWAARQDRNQDGRHPGSESIEKWTAK